MKEGPYYIDSIFAFDFSLRDFEGADLERVFIEVETIRLALVDGSFFNSSFLDQMYANGLRDFDALKFYEFMESAQKDIQTVALVSIGLWVSCLLHRGTNCTDICVEIYSNLRKLFSLNRGLSDVLRDERAGPNCIESAVLIKRMAELYGIEGNVHKSEKDGEICHRFFMTTDYKVVDPVWATKFGGFFPRFRDYMTYCHKRSLVDYD